MIKFLGLLSKKKKVKPATAASIYVALLQNVISEGFIEIKDFINKFLKKHMIKLVILN